MSRCIITYEYDDPSDIPHPVNCPNCGKWLKWNPEKGIFSCVCNKIIHKKTTGDAEEDKEWDEEDLPLAVCKKPEGWKDEWGDWLIPEKLKLLGESHP